MRVIRLGGAVLVAALIAGSVAVVGAVARADNAPAQTDPTTVPREPTLLFFEDFENATVTPVELLNQYVSATEPGVTYTADPSWVDMTQCNGFVLSAASELPPEYCSGDLNQQQNAKTMSAAVNQAFSKPGDQFAVASNTSFGTPGAGTVLETTQLQVPVPAANTTGRYLTGAMDVAVSICLNRPNYEFFGQGPSGKDYVFGQSYAACEGNLGSSPFRNAVTIDGRDYGVARLAALEPQLVNDDTVSLRIFNEVGVGKGNDSVFDNIQVYDVSPVLTKFFETPVTGGALTSFVTFRATNTASPSATGEFDILSAKPGWSFTDTFPEGVTLGTPVAAPTNGCGNVDSTGSTTTSLAVTADLLEGQAYCDIVVPVTVSMPGTYVNEANDVTTIGIDPPDKAVLEVESVPAISLTKAGTLIDTNQDGTNQAGETVDYTFVVTNEGNNTLDPITLTDTKTDPPVCEATSLAMGESTNCVVTYTLTQADIDAGSITNTATVTGTDPEGTQVTDTAEVTLPLAAQPAISLTKTAAPGELVVGDTVDYSFVIKNTGNVTLDPVALDDTLTSDETCPKTSLSAGEEMTCTGTYVITQADVDTGTIENTATATGTDPNGTVVKDDDSTSFPLDQTPDIDLVKKGILVDTNGDGVYTAGETVDYSFLVTNTGVVTLTDMKVTDSLTGEPTCEATTLAPDASTTCAISYTLTQADVDNGVVNNTATTTAIDPNQKTVEDTDVAAVVVPASPSITVTKSAAPGDLVVGDTINYTVVVTNTGNVTLSNLVIDDPLTSDETCPKTVLAPGESMDCTGTYVITQADVDKGTIENTATVTGTDPSGTEVSDSGSTTFPLDQDASIDLKKTGTHIDADADQALSIGDTVQYDFLVTNTGVVTLTNITLTDDLTGDPPCEATTLAPGASTTCAIIYDVTQADADRGVINNVAEVVGVDPSGNSVMDTDSAVVAANANPNIAVTKSAHPGPYAVGDTVNYTISVTNTGTVTLTDIVIDDALTGDEACPKVTLLPDESMECTATYVVSKADVGKSTIDNTVTVTAKDPDGDPISGSDSAVVNLVKPTPPPVKPTPPPPPVKPTPPPPPGEAQATVGHNR